MKAWLKGGIISSIIGILIALIILIISWESLAGIFYILTGGVQVVIFEVFGGSSEFIELLIGIIIYILSWFLIGAIIGYIIGKIKSKKQVQQSIIQSTQTTN